MGLYTTDADDLSFAGRVKNSDATRVAIMLCALFFLFYIYMVIRYPVLYWTDPYNRLAKQDQILIGYWPPVMQTLVSVSMKASQNLLFLRGLLSLAAAGVLFCMYFLTSRLFTTATGLFALVLLGANLLFAAMATVPYSETIFAGLVFLSLGCLENSQNRYARYLGLLALNIACLTRYEGWLLAGILILEECVRYLRSGKYKKFLPFLGRVTPLVLAPALWLVIVVSEPGGLFGRFGGIVTFTTGLETRAFIDRFASRMSLDYILGFAGNYLHLLEWQAGIGILILALVGWVRALRNPSKRYSHIRITLFLLLVCFLIAFWGPWDFTQLRQVFILEVFIILYAAYGLEQLVRLLFRIIAQPSGITALITQNGWVVYAVIVALTFLYVPSTVRFVASTTGEPKFSIPAKIGSWLEPRLSEHDLLLVLTDDPVQINIMSAYTSLPRDAILDDRFEDRYIQSRLGHAHQVYVIQLYETRSGLSPGESDLLMQLEIGQITSASQIVGGRHIWILPGRELVGYFAHRESGSIIQ